MYKRQADDSGARVPDGHVRRHCSGNRLEVEAVHLAAIIGRQNDDIRPVVADIVVGYDGFGRGVSAQLRVDAEPIVTDERGVLDDGCAGDVPQMQAIARPGADRAHVADSYIGIPIQIEIVISERRIQHDAIVVKIAVGNADSVLSLIHI